MVSPAAVVARVRSTTDVQAWNEVDVSARIAPRVDATWVSTVRYSRSSSRPVVYASGVDANIRLSEHIVVTPSYYVIVARTSTGTWSRTRVPILAATPTYTWGRWTVADRSRFVAVSGAGPGLWLYQNRLRIDYALTKGASWFVWNEASWYSVYRGWTRNRLAVGARLGLRDGIGFDAYYVRQHDTRGTPGRLEGVGVTLSVRLR